MSEAFFGFSLLFFVVQNSIFPALVLRLDLLGRDGGCTNSVMLCRLVALWADTFFSLLVYWYGESCSTIDEDSAYWSDYAEWSAWSEELALSFWVRSIVASWYHVFHLEVDSDSRTVEWLQPSPLSRRVCCTRDGSPGANEADGPRKYTVYHFVSQKQQLSVFVFIFSWCWLLRFVGHLQTG